MQRQNFFFLIWLISLATLGNSQLAYAQPANELVYRMKATITKIHSVDNMGGQSTGTGVVVAENLVATNCHTLANSVGMNITSAGETYQPVGIKADWKHDICILRFQFLPLKPVEFASQAPYYEQSTFSIGFPGGPPKPITTFGKVKALYAMDDSYVIRTNASFQLGASGSPLFNEQGQLIGMSTFKSPGRNAYYYNVPAKWIQAAMQLTDTDMKQFQMPFWAAPEEQRPYWMQIVPPMQAEKWNDLKTIAQQWLQKEKDCAEAYYYIGLAQFNLADKAAAKQSLQTSLILNKAHAASMLLLAQIAQQEGNQQALQTYKQQLTELDSDELELLNPSN
jgi:serine protease Do